MSAVALTDLGVVCSLGYGVSEIAPHLLQGKPLAALMGFRCRGERAPVGRVDRDRLGALPDSLSPYECVNHRILYAAWLQIAPAVATAQAQYGAERVAIILGSSTSGLDSTEQAFFTQATQGEYPAEYCFATQHEMGSMVSLLRSLSGISGPGYVISTACSSSAKALISARALIELGIVDAVVCGGADALCHLTLDGFDALASIALSNTNPSSQNRQGLNLGEGAALFLMQKGRGLITLVGAGESCDAHHLSAPHPEGTGAQAAMHAALQDSQLSPDQINYINLHGTGTSLNDAMEAKAVQHIFGNIACSSTKPMTGHTLGAAGALEAALCWITLHQSGTHIQFPPHLYDGVYDPDLPILNLCTSNSCTLNQKVMRFMSSSYAFGGNNCTLIMQREFT